MSNFDRWGMNCRGTKRGEPQIHGFQDLNNILCEDLRKGV